MKSPMRKSQQQLFWRDHKIFDVIEDGKLKGWFGIRIPKTIHNIVEEA